MPKCWIFGYLWLLVEWFSIRSLLFRHKVSKPVKKREELKTKKSSLKELKKRSSKKKQREKKKRNQSSSESGGDGSSESEREVLSKEGRNAVEETGQPEVGSSIWKEPVQPQNNDEDKAMLVHSFGNSSGLKPPAQENLLFAQFHLLDFKFWELSA